MKPPLAKFQIGKQGLTQQFIDSLSLAFKNRRQVRVSILKSCTRDKYEINKIVTDLLKKLPIKCNSRIIGFTIILIKTNK
jgi:RNA-binding protein YhbY